MKHDAKPDRLSPGKVSCTCGAGPFTEAGHDVHAARVEQARRPQKR